MNVLIVEDEYRELHFLTEFIERYFPDMTIIGTACNGADAVAIGTAHRVDLALLDIELPIHNGLYVAEQITKSNPDIMIIMITAYSTFPYAQKALRLGVKDYLVKPYLEEELESIIIKLTGNHSHHESFTRIFQFLPKEPEHPFTRMALRMISEHFAEELSLTELAEEIKTNADYLGKCIKKDTGMGFSELLARFRIQCAQKLLSTEHYSAAEVAGLTGFSDPNYFYRCFKKYVGISAKTYAALYLGI